MRWVLRLIATGDDARCLSTDLVEIYRPGGLGDIANLGLTLPEAKQLLVSVQRAIVAGQVDSHGQLRPCCRSCGAKCHLKDWRGHCIATLLCSFRGFFALPAIAPRRACVGHRGADRRRNWTNCKLTFPP